MKGPAAIGAAAAVIACTSRLPVVCSFVVVPSHRPSVLTSCSPRTKHCRRQAFGLEQTERKDREGRQHAKKGIAEEETEETEPEDIVEKIFNVFFGKKEEAPANLKRMTVKTFPDQYPAEKVLQAEPVEGDSKDAAVIRPLLRQTELEFRKLKLVYDAKKNGWKPAAFHKGVDFKGPGIVVAKTKGGAVVGGHQYPHTFVAQQELSKTLAQTFRAYKRPRLRYNPKGWVGYGEYRPGLSAFLFTWRDGNTSRKAVKLRKIGGAGLAVWDKPECGPLFGSDGFGIGLQKGSEKLGRSKLGSYYERLPGGINSIFSPYDDGGIAEILDFKAYVGVYAKGETIPFDDAIPFSLS